MSRAHWVFLRAYLLVATLVLVTGLGLEALLAERDNEAWLTRESTLLQGAFHLAQERLADRDVVDAAQLEQQLSEELALPASLYPLQDFAEVDTSFAGLQAGDTLLLYDTDDEAVFYRRLSDSAWVLALGPAPDLNNERAKWVVPLFYAFIALAVYLWIRPLTKDLDALRDAAQDFGEQDFSSRVSLPPGSWLAPLGDAFNSMAQRIEWLLQSHRELTHAVSHELRTPLARLRFGLEMLASAEGPDRQRHCNAMSADIEELNNLVDEMLSYAELEQGNLTPRLERLPLETWLFKYVSYYNDHTPSVPVTLLAVAPGAAEVPADERMLSRALDNLVSNAQRYAKSKVQIAARLQDGQCNLHVIDDGPGIPAEQRRAVLSAYVRLAEEEGKRRQGFGLGLAIVKRIMELHRGEVVVAEAPGGGADISLVWPLGPALVS